MFFLKLSNNCVNDITKPPPYLILFLALLRRRCKSLYKYIN
nr:MAG TPA: hypothetical protein [Caudoviricetes sp.]